MLKKTITFDDYNGKTVTEDFYFNLTKAELVELQMSEKDGFSEALELIVKSEDGKMIIEHFKKIILLSYGEKSDDGRRFKKTDELREEFAQTEAYSSLFIELATDANAATEFINGIVPAAMVAESKAAIQNVELPTAPPILEISEEPQKRSIDSYTQSEILAMSKEQFEELTRNNN